jgi:hypothetical protein
MPIIFFVISLFLSNQTANTITPRSANSSTVKETTKPMQTPADGREFMIGSDIMP